MADPVKIIGSSLKLQDKETGYVSTITVEETTERNDFKIKVKPTSGYYVTEARLKKYQLQIDNFLQNPTIINAVKTPSIVSVTKLDSDVEIVLNSFVSPALLEYASTRIQICKDRDFELGNSGSEILDFYFHQPLNQNVVKIPLSKLDADVTYYIRAGYGASGIDSVWSFPFSFKYSKPTIPTPTIEALDINYGLKYPFTTTLYVKPSNYKFDNEDLEYSLYKIYKENDDGTSTLRKTIKVYPDKLNNPNGDLTNNELFPNVIEHCTNCSITVAFYGVNGSYSEDSEKRLFTSRGIVLKPVDNLKAYPNYINISNPILAFNNKIYYNVNNQDIEIDINDIESINWTIKNETTERPLLKYNVTNGLSLSLPDGALEANSIYTVSVYYIHKLYGISQTRTETIRTRSFTRFLDLLDRPSKIYNSIGFYGEIPYSKLIPENINYTGDFIDGKFYSPGDEVSVYNKTTNDYDLYVCKKANQYQDFVFYNHFENIMEQAGKDIYKSGIPTANSILDNIGVGKVGNRINSETGWLKIQSKEGRLLYLTKLHVLDNISVNDLIKTELWHPRRKTIRLHNKLFYVRILADEFIPGYEGLDPKYKDREFYKNEALKDVVRNDESSIIKELLSGFLYDYSSTSLGFTDSTVKELVYGTEYPQCFEPRRSNGLMGIALDDVSGIDDKFYSIRLVLEYIPEDQYPIYNISKRIPGIKYSKEELKEKYRFHADTCYLGYVTNGDFLTSEAIDNKIGLFSNLTTTNYGWHRFYHKGLIYFISDGTNIKDIEIESLENVNCVKDYKVFKLNDDISEVKLGKLTYNNIVFNVGCPKVINNYRQSEIVFKDDKQINIFGDNAKYNLNLSRGSFFGDSVLNIFKKSVFDNQDNFGNKGDFSVLNNFVDISISGGDNVIIGIDKIGSGSDAEGDDATFLSSNTTEIEGRYILNYQSKPNNITFTDTNKSIVDVVFVLSVCPTIDNDEIWK